MAKGEIARFVFKKPSAAEASESAYMRERVKPHKMIDAVNRLPLLWGKCYG